MKKIFRRENLVIESRFMWASVLLVSCTSVLLFRIWFLQVYRGDYYKRVSENNRIRRIEIPAPRGMIFDAYGKIVLGNVPSSDLIYIPQYAQDRETTFAVLSRLLHVSVDQFERRFRGSRSQPKYMPIILQRNLSQHEVSIIESNKIFLPGIDIYVSPRREYLPDVPPHIVGYLGEITQKRLDQLNRVHKDAPYLPGDLIGKQGLEARWEKYLRGKRGYRLIQVDAYGRQSNTFGPSGRWEMPQVPAVPGASIELTIDMELQKAVNEAFRGKNGAVIALNPKTGALLALTSQPGYDPSMFQRGMTSEEWKLLSSDPFKPFLDKTTGGEFSPGSVYKAVVALAALEENVITPQTTYNCPGYFNLGGETMRCHLRTGHGPVNLARAIMKSCDVFFYHVGVDLGVDKIAKYARIFGLGRTLGFELNPERPGLVPTVAWKKAELKEAWAVGETPSIAIGQGYNLMTPMQMATLYAGIATRGKIWKPYLVRRVINHVGEVLEERHPELLREINQISPESFRLVIAGLESVVMDAEGTGKAARVPGVNVAGKTGSVQVVNLKRNRNQSDVSVRWKEHAMFASFAPVEDPEIVVAVVSEHDEKGGGGASAAPVAGKILQTYFRLKTQRQGLALGGELKPSMTGASHATYQ